jgi:hypothetical protein
MRSEGSWFKASRANHLQNPISKKPITKKKAGRMVQSVSPQFKLQHCNKKNKTMLNIENMKGNIANTSIESSCQFHSRIRNFIILCIYNNLFTCKSQMTKVK